MAVDEDLHHAVRVADAGQLDDDAVVALRLDDRLADLAHLVEAAVNDALDLLGGIRVQED